MFYTFFSVSIIDFEHKFLLGEDHASFLLTLKDPLISESCTEMKIESNFYFHTSLWCLKRFTFKAFIKPFEVPQRSVKIKI